MPYRARKDRRVMVESSDKTWSTGEGNAAKEILERSGFAGIRVKKDLAGHDRVAFGRRKGAGC